MPRKGPHTPVAEGKSAIIRALPKACGDEAAAVEFLEAQRWGDTPACPRCGDTDVRKMLDKEGNRNARYLWKCAGCKKQYTVRVGTVMEDSPIPLRVWCFAFWQISAGKKGVSAMQIHRQTGVSYKSALLMMHRIRLAMEDTSGYPLNGVVEMDETYVGGKPRKGDGKVHKRGRGTSKQPVVAMVERSTEGRKGKVRTRVVADVRADNLKAALEECVHSSANLVTDEYRAYPPAAKGYASHRTVTHSAGEYARVDEDGFNVHSNTVEGVFSLLKRGIYGIYHNVSRKHLHRYCTEFEFRYNTRDLEDGARVVQAIRSMEGKRLKLR
ncbi:MAG TPA: IS1595 family transposase [Longimicrobiaceae bacterium]|nr:IS1595 family transposase [Longimicrobiaceae bacterium]